MDPDLAFLFFLFFSFFNERKSHFSSDLCRASYRIVKYSGYAGDLSPQSALELLQGNENAVLVDIRPQVRDLNLSELSLRENLVRWESK